MDNENLNELEQQEQAPQAPTNTNYIEAINKLRQNSVSKDSYDKLLEENKNLLDSIVNGTAQASAEAENAEKKPTIEELRKALYYPEKSLNDLEYVTRSVALRDALLEETGEDCYVATSHLRTPTDEEYVRAQKCADVYKECIEEANGNNSKFIAALQSRIADVAIPSRKNTNIRK